MQNDFTRLAKSGLSPGDPEEPIPVLQTPTKMKQIFFMGLDGRSNILAPYCPCIELPSESWLKTFGSRSRSPACLSLPLWLQWAGPLVAAPSLVEGRSIVILIRGPTRDGHQQGRRLPHQLGVAALTLAASLLRRKDEER